MSENRVRMMRLGESEPMQQADIISLGKLASKIESEARRNAKGRTCDICKTPCSSFCNSHSIPEYVLRRVSEVGYVTSILEQEVRMHEKDIGVGKAGTFHLICNSCDNTIFQEYEDPEAYASVPTDKMLAQIALKNYLQMISKRYEERETYKIVGEKFPIEKGFANEKIFIGEFDLTEFRAGRDRALRTIKTGDSNYYLCYYRNLDYVVPYTAQAAVAMIGDFNDRVINNIYNFSEGNHIKYIHVAVFPLETTSAVMLFVNKGEKRYRNFYRQLNKLSAEDQLAAINYIVFSYTENVFLNPSVAKQMKKYDAFMDVCRKTGDFSSQKPNFDESPLPVAISEFSLSKRHSIPNLLNKEYALEGI